MQGNMIGNNETIEQLWYTWSDIGIDTIMRGDRIRAASAGLQDPRSDLIRRLDPYQRYSLPRDANPSIDPKLAPICLAFINTGKERILIHKEYTGKDGIGRYGAFFIHLLVNLPEEFSVIDAISLWQSPFWQNSDVTLPDRRSTHLNRISFAKLKQQQQNIPLDQQSSAKIEEYLPYVIQAYLTKNLLMEKINAPWARQQLYIAAPDRTIAQLILGLTSCLPTQLVKNLTFSTYEHDVTEATTEIVGTCWLSVPIPEPEKDSTLAQLLSAHYYQEKLALNCYIGRPPQLENHPQVLNHPLATQCAQDATDYYLNRKGSPEFQDLLETARNYPNLSINKFLELYEMIVIRPRNPSPSDFDRPLNPEIAAKQFSRSSYREMLIGLVLNVPNWWATHKKKFSDLRRYIPQFPKLGQAFTQIARDAIPFVVEIVEKEITLPVKAAPVGEVTTGNEARFHTMVDMMRCVAPLEEAPSIWHDLLNKLFEVIKRTPYFLGNHPSIYAEVMRIAMALSASESKNKRITPPLTISWAEFGYFLTLGLPLDWVETATKELVYQSPPPNQAEIARLGQKYHAYIKKLLLLLAEDTRRRPTAIALFNTLMTNGYQEKIALLFALLDSPVGKDNSSVKQLLQEISLTPDEKVRLLERYGPNYLPESKLTRILLGMFGEVAQSNLQKEKMRVMFSWFDSPPLSPWFETPNTGEKNLAAVLKTAALTTDQNNEFLQGSYGGKYILLHPGSPTLIEMFDTCAKSQIEWRIPLLSTWLDCKLQERVLEQVVAASRLTNDEMVGFLQGYGERYLSLYPQLINYLEEAFPRFLNFLLNANIAIFKDSLAVGEPSVTERRLGLFAKYLRSPGAQKLAFDWYNVARFVRLPSLLRQEWKPIAPSIGQILNNTEVQPQMGTDLLRKLAIACITNEGEVMSIMGSMGHVLALSVLAQLFYTIAETAREGIYQGRYPKTLYVPCIQSALEFKAALHPEAQQVLSVERFLNRLLQNADEKTFKWLNAQAKQWSPNISDTWWSFSPQPSSSAPPSLFERIELSRERRRAFSKMYKVLKDKRPKHVDRILKVGTDYIIILSDYHDEVPDEYWQLLDDLLNIRDMTGPMIAQTHQINSKPIHFARIRSWWKRRVAFTQTWLALRSRKIGRIVRVATDHMIVLDQSGERVPDTWWRQIDVAFDIFTALEVDYDETEKERNREQDIVAASQKFDELVESKHPTPRLTMHEWRRIKAARQQVANQDAQKIRDEQRQKALPIQQDSFASEKTTQLPPGTIRVKGSNKGQFLPWGQRKETR